MPRTAEEEAVSQLVNYVGIDPSLSATAVCVYSPTQCTQPWTGLFMSKPQPGLRGRIERYQDIVRQVSEIIVESKPVVVCIEGHSFGSQGRGTLDRAEFRGLLSAALLNLCGRVYEVPPTCLKLFATGKGSGGKPPVVAACAKRYGVEYETDDEYDAFVLARMAACIAGADDLLAAFQGRAIDAVVNPKTKTPKRRKASA